MERQDKVVNWKIVMHEKRLFEDTDCRVRFIKNVRSLIKGRK